MNMIFCSDVLHKNKVEEDYYKEFKFANINNICSLVDHDLIQEGELEEATKHIIKTDEPRMGIYRGWMLNLEEYENLYNALKLKNLFLINNPNEYKNCHHFPYSFDIIRNYTPESIWVSNYSKDLTPKLVYDTFGECSVILKDYVKSAKHYWNTACFISNVANFDIINSVVSNFINVRGDVEGGFVFRKYVPLEKIGKHPTSKVPIANEYRLFFLDKKLISMSTYWAEGNYIEVPDTTNFEKVAEEIDSNFFSMDIAKTTKGDWIIIELGDGQVAGLPENCDVEQFYKELRYGSSQF